MTLTDLSTKLAKRPFMDDEGRARQVKLVFLLNLLALANQEMEFTDKQVLDARDALESNWARRMISETLGLEYNHEHERYVSRKPVLAGPHDRTVMPLLANEHREITQDKLVTFIRPDPRMTIEVQKHKVATDPSVDIYTVVIEDGRGGSWNETFVTEDLLRAFLRGVRVTYAMSDLQKLLPAFGDDAPIRFTEQSAVDYLP